MKVFRNEQVHLRQTSLFSNSKVQNNGSTVPMMDDPVEKIEKHIMNLFSKMVAHKNTLVVLMASAFLCIRRLFGG
jgi:hypothetical protein